MNRVGLILSFALFCIVCQAQNTKVSKEATPTWINNAVINYQLSNLDNNAEDGYVDLDYERQVSLATQTKYCRKAIKILSESGVQNSSEISVDFDPSYQKLVFHTIKIIRGNQVIDKMQSAKFKIVQQEKDLDKHLYDGSLTAISFLEDVRKGDVLEYSYSVKGFNPIFNNKYTGFFDVQYGVPVYNLIYKLVVPKGRNLTIKNKGTDLRPAIQESNSETVYEWKLNQLQPLRVPDHLPNWYDPYPEILISEFSSWKEVSDWARNLYPFDVQLSPALQSKISEIKQRNSSEETKTLAALRFVQDEIRYTGIEAGENSHRPHHPNQIFAQRFGDCKDKSYLLCVMLRRMGVEADPVLINTDVRKGIANWLPSPGIFDHVTVRVKINNDVYWFDPTISYQRGSIKDISYPDYQCGLVVSESTNALTIIPLHDKGIITVKEKFNVPDMSGRAYLVVETRYTGSYADNTRDDFKNNSRYEMLKKYKEYYTSYYNNIKEDSISYSDDEASGVATTVEYYTVNNFWEVKDGIKKASLQPFLIDEALKKPREADRSAPYSLSFPVHYIEDIEINLPKDWTVHETSDSIQTPASVFKYDYSYSGNQVTLKYEYEQLKDFVAPEELPQYLTAYKKIDENAGFELTSDENAGPFIKSSHTTSAGSTSIFPALYTLLVLALLITISVRRNRRKNNFGN